MLPQTGALLAQYPILFLQLQAIFGSGGYWALCVVCSQYEWLFFQTPLHSLSCMETQHPLAKAFLAMWETILFCFEADFYLLLLMVLNSACRRGYRELIPHLLSPEHLRDWILLGCSTSVTTFSPWPMTAQSFFVWKLSTPSAILAAFEIFPVFNCAAWEQGGRTTLVPPGVCSPCIWTAVSSCPMFEPLLWQFPAQRTPSLPTLAPSTTSQEVLLLLANYEH